ncbi:sulfatase family protein [Reichenbachiella sp.]|uniref:sulfatase family protein n=1 Tax=Reichenbachiella sp. TaxID=2184521 RepID=UPI003BB18D25
MKIQFLIAILIGSLSCLCWSCDHQTKDELKPNIIIFYVDDLGYGDLSGYGAKGVSTPNVDRLVNGGLKFTDAHSPAATCTPSRYSLLTGEYAFRNNARILPGDAPLLIDTAKLTLPKMLKKAGYTSAVVGKWHLGLGNGQIDWNGKVSPGPLEIGFDYSFLLPATGDRVPSVYLENHHVVGLDPADPIQVSYNEKIGNRPTGIENPELLRYAADRQHSETIVNGISRIGYMAGGESALWKDEDFANILTEKANRFIADNQEKPFFLYFSFHDIHVPRLPHDQFLGKSQMGLRGDAIVQMDWMTGQVMSQLRKLGLEENTLVIFTSDNGPVLNDGYEDKAVELLGEHQPGGVYRGGKYSAFEAGTRVPFVAYWPDQIQAGESKALFTQTDLLASLAHLTEVDIEGADIDAENQLDALLGLDSVGREVMLEEAFAFALRKGHWKYIAPVPAQKAFPNWLKNKTIEGGVDTIPQLFDLSTDPAEQVNLAQKNSELVTALQQELQLIVEK